MLESHPYVIPSPKVICYHGTTVKSAENILKLGVDVMAGASRQDFGRAFYASMNLSQAHSWANQKSTDRNEPAAVIAISLLSESFLALRRRVFDAPGPEFWALVISSRKQEVQAIGKDADYDVVAGPVAKRWWSEPFAIHRNYDQVAFRSKVAQDLLNDATRCSLEICR